MKKPRLFVFGDSFAFNYFSNRDNLINATPHFGNGAVKGYAEYYNFFGHWTDHFQNFYDVYSFGQGAVSNEQIFLQLGYLEDFDFVAGDRIVIIYTTPERFNVVVKKIKYHLAPNGLLYKNLFSDINTISFIENQYIERGKRWNDINIVKEEKKFINILKTLLSKWDPIFLTWTSSLNVDSVECVPFSFFDFSIYKESFEHCDDYHLGVQGNYKLFKLLADRLKLDITGYSYIPQPFIPRVL